MRRAIALVLVSLAALLAASTGALADGDPASDVLIFHTLYTPLSQKVSPEALDRLRQTISAAGAGGYTVRVALILDRTDLGAYPELFGHPSHYATLLAAEDRYDWRDPVVIVQPSGVGVGNVRPVAPAQRLVARIPVARPVTSDALAQAATVAVRELAAASGHPVVSSGRSWTPIVAAGVALGLLVPAVMAVVMRRRRAG
jgi:hypothetical protein